MTNTSTDNSQATTDEHAMLYTVEDHVATITFNRPEQQNTISGAMLNRFSEMLLAADQDLSLIHI